MCFKKSPHQQKHKRDKTDFCYIRKKENIASGFKVTNWNSKQNPAFVFTLLSLATSNHCNEEEVAQQKRKPLCAVGTAACVFLLEKRDTVTA